MTIKPFFMACSLLLLAACGGDSDNGEAPKPQKPDVIETNANANKSAIKEYSRLEMPRLHDGRDTILIHKTTDGTVNYIIEWDLNKKSQRWSCYVLNKEFLKKSVSRYYSDTNQYPKDPLIPTSMQWSRDPYYSNGQRFDHGHICPSADRLNSSEANYQTFFLTNMQPQFNAFNAGVWAKMENKVRTIAATCDTLYICKGGTIDEGLYGGYNKVYRTLDNGLVVPRYFFMALLRANKGNYDAIGLWIDQVSNVNDSGTNLYQYAVSIDELEKRTGIDFFCNLPDNTENKVESTKGSQVSWAL